MKLISLNTWGGKYFEPLIEFIKNSQTTDIFCFQEVYDTTSNIKQYIIPSSNTEILRITKNTDSIRANLLDEFKNILKEFKVSYFPTLKGYDDVPNPVNFNLTYGPAIFVKSSVNIISQNNYFITETNITDYPGADFAYLSTPLQQISFNLNDKTFHIFNFHGTTFPVNKLDSSNRFEEVKKVKKIMAKLKEGGKILVGDFNLFPNTKCIKLFEENMINLINKFNIPKTRSKLTPYFGTDKFQPFADYAFVSKEVRVDNFEVPYIEISDHLPLILEFS